MKLIDSRLYRAKSIQDFLFRLFWDENEYHSRFTEQEFSIEYLSTFTNPDPSRVLGIDISHWNGVVNLSVGKAAGLSFVIIKGCDGTIPSRYFQENKEQAKIAELPWGVYVWLYPGNKVSVGLQTQAWWDLVKNDYPPLGVWIDFEWTTYNGVAANPTTGDLISALDKFQALSGRRVGIYSAKGYTDQYLVNFPNPDSEMWWIANYGVTAPALPRGVTRYKFWQFTNILDAIFYGSDPVNGAKAFDGDYYYGTMVQFNNEFGAYIPPDTGGNMQIIQGVVIAEALNIRPDPSNMQPAVGLLVKNDRIEADPLRKVNQWLPLTKINDVPVTANWWASAGINNQYINWQLVDVVTPPPPPPPPAVETREFIEQKTMIDPDGARWVGDAHFTLTKQP